MKAPAYPLQSRDDNDRLLLGDDGREQPVDDLAVRKGWAITYAKRYMPTKKELLAFGERWRPYRTVASWYMWRALDNVP